MSYKVAVVGATGAVGREILQILAEREFPASEVVALASDKSTRSQVSYGEDKVLTVGKLDDYDFEGTDIVLSSAGAAISADFVPRATEAAAVVIDNTSHYRMDPDPTADCQYSGDSITAHSAVASRSAVLHK